MFRLLIAIPLLIIGCGSDVCNPYTSKMTEEDVDLIMELEEVFVGAGYDVPCCPVYLLKEGDIRLEYLDKMKSCGAMKGELGDHCTFIMVDATQTRKGCSNVPRTVFHEWLHEQGHPDGEAIRILVDRLLYFYAEYLNRNLSNRHFAGCERRGL